ncbi:hypothetical protein SBADM41S_01005 [Streptomyces badius]
MSSTRTGASDSMPSTAMPSAILPSSSPSSGWASARAAARSRTWSVSSSSRQGGAHSPCAATSSDRWSAHLEVADLLDLVAPELHSEGVLLGRREDVQDPAAYGELAALLNQFHPGVRGGRQRVHHLPQIRALPARKAHRLQIAEPLDLRLEHRADRGDDDGDRAGLRVVLAGVRQAAQHGEAAAHGVGAGREPLVRQGLPGRELRDRVRRQHRTQGRGQVLGLAARGGDGQDGPAGLPGQRGHGERARAGRAHQVDMGPVPVSGGLHRLGERRVRSDDSPSSSVLPFGAAIFALTKV